MSVPPAARLYSTTVPPLPAARKALFEPNLRQRHTSRQPWVWPATQALCATVQQCLQSIC